MNNYKKHKDLIDMLDDSMHEIKFKTTGQMRTILETQASWFDMTLSQYVHRSLHVYMEMIAEMSGYDAEKELEHFKKQYSHND